MKLSEGVLDTGDGRELIALDDATTVHDPNAAATPPPDEARFPRLRKPLSRIKQAGQAVGQVAMDWVSIPRQLRYLAWALIALSVAYLVARAMHRR